jgi:pimeloyl-ACP methyl ester carboxylesterase
LPNKYALDARHVRTLGENPERVLKTTQRFERLLPSLILNLAILHRDQRPAATLARQPAKRTGPRKATEPAWRAFQRRQKVRELGDRFVSYIDEGTGEPVVLLHGIPTWGYLWEDTIRVLTKDNRVIAPDLLGFGYSDKRDCFDRSIAAQTRRIAEFLDALEIESAHLVAHDIGGGVALRLATLHSERVRSLCLMNTICYDSWPIEMMLQFGHPLMRKKLSAATALKALRLALKMGFHSAPDREWLDGLLSPWRTEVGKLSLIRNASALNTNLTTEITHLLPRIPVPTLILWGEDDKFQRVEMGERLARDIPGAELHRIADARHFVMIDQPAAVHGHIKRFLRDLPQTEARVTTRVALRAGYAVGRSRQRRERVHAR